MDGVHGTLEPCALEEYAHVRGMVDTFDPKGDGAQRAPDGLRGTFDILLGEELSVGDFAHVASAPDDAPSTPLAGVLWGRTVAVKSARVVNANAVFVNELADACASAGEMGVIEIDPAAALLGKPQPILSTLTDPLDRQKDSLVLGWARVEQTTPTVKGVLRVAAMNAASNGSRDHLEGRFEAVSCP
jgi:hypothetical protein